MKRHNGITPERWDPITWSQLPAHEALKNLLDHVVAEASEAESWYRRHKDRLSFWSKAIRALAIAFGTAGGLAPIVAGLRFGLITPEFTSLISQLGYLLIGVAAGLLAFDRYFGVSSGWLRYVTALTGLQHLKSALLLEWSQLLLAAPVPSSPGELLPFLESARAFQLAVVNLVAMETEAWSTEFQSSAADLEKLVRREREQARDLETKGRHLPAAPRSRPGRGRAQNLTQHGQKSPTID